MEQVRVWAEGRDAKDIRLSVWAFNDRARRMYEELGYEVRALEMGLEVR